MISPRAIVTGRRGRRLRSMTYTEVRKVMAMGEIYTQVHTRPCFFTCRTAEVYRRRDGVMDGMCNEMNLLLGWFVQCMVVLNGWRC